LGDGIPLLCGDAHFLPFTDCTFDAIASFEVIYYLPNQSIFLSECRRILTPDGKLILCWSNPDWESFAPGKHSLHYPTSTEVSALLKDVGFGKTDFYGAFSSTQASAKTKWVNRIRQVVVRSGLSVALETMATPLMRAAYGELQPLPERLKLDELDANTQGAVPLDPAVTEPSYRVLYVVARVST